MTHSNASHPSSSAEHSAFQGTQNALARKALPGPAWAWPVLGALVAAGLVFVVTSSPAEHGAPRTAQADATLNATTDVLNLAPAPAAVPEANPTPAAAPGAPTPPDPGSAVAVVPPGDGAAAGAPAAADAPKPSDATESSAATPAKKKKGRAAARRSSRKRAAD